MAETFTAVVETYALRERAEEHAELLRKHDVQATAAPSQESLTWGVVVPVAQFPNAAKLTEAARLTGELRIP